MFYFCIDYNLNVSIMKKTNLHVGVRILILPALLLIFFFIK